MGSRAQILTIFLLSSFLVVQTAGAARPTFAVWMKLSGVKGLSPAEIRQVLDENDIQAVFFLVPLPPQEEELERISNIRNQMKPGIDFHAWITTFRNREYVSRHPESALVSNTEISDSGLVNPLHMGYRNALLEWIEGLESRLQPDGFFLDYFTVPYPGPFDNSTIKSFSIHMNINLTLANITSNQKLLGRFFEWRNQGMVDLLNSIRQTTQGELSIFIDMFQQSERLARGQDVEAFSTRTDFLVAHTYHFLMQQPPSWVGGGVKALKAEGAGEVWSGIQAFDIPAKQVREAVNSAMKSEAQGIILFRFGTTTEDYWNQLSRARSPGLLLPAVAILAIVFLIGFGLHRHRSGDESPVKSNRKR